MPISKKNIAIALVSIVILTISSLLIYKNYEDSINYSTCSDFPIYISKPWFYGTFTVGNNPITTGEVTTVKDSKSIKIAKLNIQYGEHSISIGKTLVESDSLDQNIAKENSAKVLSNYKKMTECIDTKGKYTVAPY